MKYKVAIIGTGAVAISHIAACRQEQARVDLVAAMDVERARVEAFGAQHDISQRYTDVAEMLAAHKPDVVLIGSPPGVHRAQIIECLEAGAWVLCEKPFVRSLAELDEIEAAERRTGRYAASVFQMRFGSGARHLRRLIAEGTFGRPLVGMSQTTWYRDDAYYAVDWRSSADFASSGVTATLGVHNIDLALSLLGDWQEVRAMIGTQNHDMQTDDAAIAAVRFENGAMLSITNSTVSPKEETYLRLDFEKATVEVRYVYGYSNDNWQFSIPAWAPDREKLIAASAIPDDIPTKQATQFAAFLDSLARGERPAASGPGVRPTLEFITALYKAAITGRPVRRGEITQADPFYGDLGGRGAG
ncbi:MAG: Gfo/Idh/MocA family oxidoreductase [Anaerolineae bacterium]|nr:Gfo/Idh/MocA family oxidoreductase [Anaerolineae bacterium]